MLQRITTKIKKIVINIVYTIMFHFKKTPQVYSINETLDYILNNKCSVARFGDGEIKWIYEINHPSFQKVNKKMGVMLKKELKQINRDNRRIIICVPEFFNGLNQFNNSAKYYYQKNFIKDGGLWLKLLPTNQVFYNSDITRPYIDYKDKTESKVYFEKWKKIFAARNILMVEGQSTHFGVGNDLLNSAKSVRRIICPSENAFDKYIDIKKAIIKYSSKIPDPLVLIALGPTATILSYELSLEGIQAIDIGHTDLEYEWFLNNDMKKVRIKNRVVNELGENSKDLPEFKDKDYQSEIIGSIL